MAIRQVLCPSGLEGQIRGIKGKEFNLFTNRDTASSQYRLLNALCAAVWERTDNSGPYQFEGDSPDWQLGLTGDRYFIALQALIATYGAEQSFRVQCDRFGCGLMYDHDINLGEVPVTMLDEGVKSRWAAGDHERVHLPECGKWLDFHIQTGKDELRGSQELKGSNELFTTGCALRVEEIEGLHPNENLRFLEEIDGADMVALLDAMDAADCGVESMTESTCEYCGMIKEVEFPLLGAEFWLPTKRRKRHSATSSSSSQASQKTKPEKSTSTSDGQSMEAKA